MTNAKTAPAENLADREIVITRVFDAPRELIWNAWTDHGPDGTDYPTQIVFVEVVKPERIVYSMTGGKKGDLAHESHVTWTFEAQGDKTKLTLRMLFPSADVRERVAKTYGFIEGGNQTLDRLGDHLAKSSGR